MNRVEMLFSMRGCETEKEKRDMVFIGRSLVITVVVVGSLVLLMRMDTIQRNDALLREASALRTAKLAWITNSETFEATQDLRVIRGRAGMIELNEGLETIGGKTFEMNLCRTNSVLGDGRLSLIKSGNLIWIGEDGSRAVVQVPQTAGFSLSYSLRIRFL